MENLSLMSEVGQPDYELARAIWMVDFEATGKSFDRLKVSRKNAKIEHAQKIMEALGKASHVVMHEDDIDGG